MLRFVALLVLLLVAGPATAATQASLDLTDLSSIALDGDVRIDLAAPQLRLDATVPGEAELRLQEGRVTIYTWRVATGQVGTAGYAPAVSDPDATPFEVAATTLRVVHDGPLVLALSGAATSTATLSGSAFDRGLPVLLGPDAAAPPTPSVLDDRADKVRPAWREGLHFYGDYTLGTLPRSGFPALDTPRVDLAGPVKLHLFHGIATFTTSDGQLREFVLGPESDAPVGAPVARIERWTRLVFEGTLESADVPLSGDWALAGERPAWRVDGEGRFDDAHGSLVVGDVTYALDGASILGTGAFTATPGTAEGASPFAVGGSFETLALDGALVDAPPTVAPPEAVAGASLAALLLAFLAKPGAQLAGRVLAAAMYTRIAPGDLLSHPKRARIHESVRETPGIHARELAREIGGGWGAFDFHLRLLLRAGMLFSRREGRYLALYPPGSTDRARLPRDEARMRVHDALPLDGSAVPLVTLREQLGMSRQLLDHHAKALASEGLVVREPTRSGIVLRRVRETSDRTTTDMP